MILLHYHLSIVQALFLFLAGLFASVIDTVAGGGGMITLPSLLSIGFPPATALGTNRLQGCVSELTAAFRFFKKGHIDLKKMWPGFLFVAVGSGLGSILIQMLHPSHLQKILPFCLLAVFVYFLFSPRLRTDQIKQRLSPFVFYSTIGVLIGFYNGFFGPGTGSLWILALMYFLGVQIDKAVMEAKPFNTVGNIASIICFAIQGHIVYWTLLFMGPGQILGANVGAYLVMKHGTWLVRPMFIIVFAILMIKLFYSAFY